MVEAEQEERRLSYLSDWCSSVTSAAELHVCVYTETIFVLDLVFLFVVANEDYLF